MVTGGCLSYLAQDFNTAAQDSNPGPLSRESEALATAPLLYIY